MINPHMLKATTKRWNNPIFAGGKMYLAVLVPVGLHSRRMFRRASEAEAYAQRLLARWCRLYDERVQSQVEPATELPASEVQG